MGSWYKRFRVSKRALDVRQVPEMIVRSYHCIAELVLRAITPHALRTGHKNLAAVFTWISHFTLPRVNLVGSWNVPVLAADRTSSLGDVVFCFYLWRTSQRHIAYALPCRDNIPPILEVWIEETCLSHS